MDGCRRGGNGPSGFTIHTKRNKWSEIAQKANNTNYFTNDLMALNGPNGSGATNNTATLQVASNSNRTLKERNWYDFWIVINNDSTKLTDIYVKSDTDTAFATQTKITTTSIVLPPANAVLNSLYFWNGRPNVDQFIDDLYVDRTGVNLAAIPEPAALGALALGGAALLGRRRP